MDQFPSCSGVSRRSVLVRASSVGVALASFASIVPRLARVSAQTSPGLVLGSEVRFRATEGAFDSPSTVPAGSVVIALENALDRGYIGIDLMRVPDGMTVDQIREELNGDEIPDWFFTAKFAGGAFALRGQTSRIVVDLEPGDWVALQGITGAEPFRVNAEAGGSSVATGELATVLSIVETDRAFSGIPDSVTMAPQLWKVMNAGNEIHHLLLVRSPVPLTEEEALTVLTYEDGEELPAHLPRPSEVQRIGGLGLLSPGRSAWLEVDLEAGTYVALCLVPADTEGSSHAELGMLNVFSVGG